MTIPNLVVIYQKKQTVVRLRKVYSDLNNAVQLSEIDNGPMSTWDFPKTATYNYEDIEGFIKTYYLPYFKSAKLYKPDNFNDYTPKQLNGNNVSSIGAYLQLNNGVHLRFFSNIPNGYIWILTDINGKSGPNIIGRDIFVFDAYRWLNSNGKYKIRFWNLVIDTKLADRNDLRYAESGNYSCNPKNTTGHYVGYYCGALIEYDNWTIADDYPW